MNLFDFSLKLKGFPLEKAKQHLIDIQNINEKEYATYIEKKKKDIVSYHLKHNNFYKEFAKNANIEAWKSVPVMTKADLQYPLESLFSEGFTKKNVYIDKTSGASGQPFIFSKDKYCHALTWAVIQNRFGWHHINFNTSKQARFYGIPINKKGYYIEKLKDFVGNRIRFNVFDLSDEALESWLKTFKTYEFEYLNGYTSSIVQFAKFLERKTIVLKTICPSLKVCIVTSEILFDLDRILLQKQFGVPVINEYGASELDLIAFENINKKWIVNGETLFVEILDKNNNPVSFGEEGRIVITSLFNKSQPFIRYDIGDIGVLSKESTIKKPILEKLIGRTNDIAILPSGKKAPGLTFYYVTKSIIENDGNVKEFIIEQHEINAFKILYVSDDILSNDKIKNITIEMEKYLEKGLTISFERQEQLVRSKSGKLKQFSSYLN
ncbi:phenylacetate--CoA ligase family protein [Seonamhaeicola maritimus]|uniref:Phenylacetate--CoA ligase family protein n=1 Tax=Seonamhaeicola maritimus TaxID=2591822 RepID=A0A5C7GI05_9FLAO|nr:phenylacetate--CoA ligase family protein [Seonamhaeicola maritimus]TXG37143.1 phenylacetate--CoA ligase family protein [Seonamhaeicola maritimus]